MDLNYVSKVLNKIRQAPRRQGPVYTDAILCEKK